jgi:hypothetical protein
MYSKATHATLLTSRFHRLSLLAAALWLALPLAAFAQGGAEQHEGGIIEPVTSHLQGKTIRVPNTDQSADGVQQTLMRSSSITDARQTTSLLGHPITRVESPNLDMRLALEAMLNHAKAGEVGPMQGSAQELLDILLGTTQGRIYDGFAMLNFNRWKDSRITAAHFPPDALPGEYKMKVVTDTGETFVSPFDGETRKIWEVNVNMLYYDGQIDSDTFLLRYPIAANRDDTVRVHYRIYSLVREDFSPTLVMLDRREALNTVQFPFKGFDAVWEAFERGDVLDVTVDYPPIQMMRGVYTWGWRVHPPRIQFMQPLYEQFNQQTQQVELDSGSKSYAFRNREDLTLDAIGEVAPEMKMYKTAMAALSGASVDQIEAWLTDTDQGPRGTLYEWADLALEQRQLPPEAWDIVEAEEGLARGTFGDFNMISVFLNNEMYGAGPRLNEISGWDQGDTFKIKLINLDHHTHYFRNVDFGTRLNDDILRCCGGGETSFEVMNFKGTYGIPKVAEMQWRAGWGFRPHHDVIQQDGTFSRGSDRALLKPYTGGFGETYFGYQFSEKARKGDFRFNPPNFIISDDDPPFPLRDADGQPGIVLGQFTEGTGIAQLCPNDPPGFCTTDFGPTNPNGALNFPAPNDPTIPKTELRFPPFLRNPAQGQAGAGDIIPPTGAWEPYLFINPYTGSLYIDPDDPSKGYWTDLTYQHGRPVFAQTSAVAHVELPRAGGQVFYQFDDLFHDNSIFSPHPLFEGEDEVDEMVNMQARMLDGKLAVNGRLENLSTGRPAAWVTLYPGTMTDGGACASTIALASIEVNDRSGRFYIELEATGVVRGDKVCVQSTVGAARIATVR